MAVDPWPNDSSASIFRMQPAIFAPQPSNRACPCSIAPGANARLLFKWLGGRVAVPDWDGDSVSFYMQDDSGARLEDAVCQPASDEDLKGPLKDDLIRLRERLDKAKAESPSERIVLQKIREDFTALIDDAARLDRDSYFFRCRDAQHRMRLVWCPGYQRRDAQAAPAVICTDPECNLLFVRKPGASARCPGCRSMALLAAGTPQGRRRSLLALLFLLLLCAFLVYWLFPRPKMTTVADQKPSVAAGDAVPPKKISETDSKSVDTKTAAKAIDERAQPVEIVIASDQGPAVRFPVGSEFNDFRVEARYSDGFTRIVTKQAMLHVPENPAAAAVAFSAGRMRGLRPGKTTVAAEFDGVRSKQGLEVDVVETPIGQRQLLIEPAIATIHPGQQLAYIVTGVREGKRRVVQSQDGLKLTAVDPSVAGLVADDTIRANAAGQTKVVAELGAERAEATLNVTAGSGASGLVVDTPGPGFFVSDPDGVAYWVGPRGVLHHGVSTSVAPRDVVVAHASDRVWIDPPRASLAVGETTPRFAVMAQSPGGPSREIPATVESTNPAILAAASGQPARFLARQMGNTQVRAAVGDRLLYADVTVTGARFETIHTSIASPTDRDFAIRAEITAAGAEGRLEYRVVRAGQNPPDRWVAAQVEGNHRRVTLESPRLATGPPSTFYTLTFEARDPANGSIQQYPFTFRLSPQIERAEK